MLVPIRYMARRRGREHKLMMELDLHRVGLGPGHDMTPYIMTGSRTITHCRRPWFERL